MVRKAIKRTAELTKNQINKIFYSSFGILGASERGFVRYSITICILELPIELADIFTKL